MADIRDELTAYLLDPGTFDDPYPLLRAARKLGPVVESDAGAWAVLGFDAVETVLTDETFSRALATQLECQAIEGGTEEGRAAADVFRQWFFNMDPPQHTRLRKLASPAFRPTVVAQFAERVDEVTAALIDELLEAKQVDFLAAFAYQLPHRVICDMLGVPPEDHARWGSWLHTIMEGNKVAVGDSAAALRDAFDGFGRYCQSLLRARAAAPGHGLIGSLLSATEAGDAMTESELVSTLSLLVIAGHETTVHLLGNGLYCLLRQRDQWRQLRNDPSLVPGAVEECLRFEPSARIRPRITRRRTTLAGVDVPEGATVQPIVSAANRDPDRFERPDEFNIAIKRPAHLTFGFGAHYCLGAPVARLEASVALRELAARVDLDLLEEPTWRHAAHRSLERLDVEVRARA